MSFLRTRHAFADGGDLGRIKAQQGFLSALTRKIKDDGTLTNPAQMLGIADAITKNLTIDDGLASVPTLLTVGNRLKNIDVGKVAFVATPTVPADTDTNRLQLAEPAASQLFAAMRNDVDLTDPTAPSRAASPPPVPAPAPTPSATAAGLRQDAAARHRGQRLRRSGPDPGDHARPSQGAGFTQVGQLTAPPVATTAVYYGADYADVAADVAALLGVAPRRGCSRPPASPVSRSTWAVTSPRDADRGRCRRSCPRTSSTRQPATPSASRPTRHDHPLTRQPGRPPFRFY